MPSDNLCVFESLDGKITPAVQQAIALAQSSGSHLTLISAVRLAHAPSSMVASSLVAGALKVANDQAREVAQAAANVAQDAARIAGANCTIALHEDTLTGIAEWLGRRARIADMTIVDRPVNVVDAPQAFFEDALFASGRPVLVASPDTCSKTIKRMAVAWNGSRVSARALGDALALFPSVSQVDVIVVTGEKEAGVPGAEVTHHLARRGVNANLVNVPRGDSIAQTINDTALRHEADMIVMGGFGHSRLREFVLGGVTRELTGTAKLPLFLSH